MYSKDYEILVKRLTIENNNIRDRQLKWMAEGNNEMIEIGEIAHKHNDETIRFIKKLDKELANEYDGKQ